MARKKRGAQSAGEPWLLHFFQRHQDDDPKRAVPAEDFLDNRQMCPEGIAADLLAVVDAVAKRPPPQFSGGLQWQAMKKDMRGYHEARVRGGKWLYRLFCFLENPGTDLGGPSVVVITGMRKPNETAFTSADYAYVRSLGDEFKRRRTVKQ